MTIPAFLFGFFISTFYGTVFHLWKDGGLGRLLLYVILSWAGFSIGQIAAGLLGWSFLDIGPIHFGLATLGAVAILGVGHWLSLVQIEKTTR
jgi:hypothetical protein